MPSQLPLRLAHWLVAVSIVVIGVGTGATLAGCPGQCLVHFKSDVNGKQSSGCLIDTCPNNSSLNEQIGACACKPDYVLSGGACVTLAEANASCGRLYTYANGACVAKTCAPGQQLNGDTGACENKKEADIAVATNAGTTVKPGQTVSISCPPGHTYVVNGRDGACIPNELTCGPGTRFENNRCVSLTCPPGMVWDPASTQCVKLAKGDEKVYSVQAKLAAAMGPDFCAPHAKNPGAWRVAPGTQTTIRVAVTVNVPGNQIDSAQVGSIRVTNAAGTPFGVEMPGVANVTRQVNEQILPGIRALGGKSLETSATSEVPCLIKRAPLVIETHGGGI